MQEWRSLSLYTSTWLNVWVTIIRSDSEWEDNPAGVTDWYCTRYVCLSRWTIYKKSKLRQTFRRLISNLSSNLQRNTLVQAHLAFSVFSETFFCTLYIYIQGASENPKCIMFRYAIICSQCHAEFAHKFSIITKATEMFQKLYPSKKHL